MAMGITIIGAGGHAKVVAGSAIDAGYTIELVVDKDPGMKGKKLLGHLVGIQSTAMKENVHQAAIIAVGDNRTRQRLATDMHASDWVSVVHPKAYVHPSVKIGPGTLVCAGAIIQPDAEIGAHAIINTGAIVEHDTYVGDFAHVGPAAVLGGGVRVEEGAFVGLGVKVKPLMKVGAWSIVGVGAVVVGDVNPRATIIGNPARPMSRR